MRSKGGRFTHAPDCAKMSWFGGKEPQCTCKAEQQAARIKKDAKRIARGDRNFSVDIRQHVDIGGGNYWAAPTRMSDDQ